MTTLTQRERHHDLSVAQTRSLRERNGVPEGYFTTGGAATYLECRMDAIWTAIKTGKLTGERFGRLTCFTKEELDAFDARRRGTPVLDTAVDTPPRADSRSP
jgi:excisionase family DNA binding protein